MRHEGWGMYAIVNGRDNTVMSVSGLNMCDPFRPGCEMFSVECDAGVLPGYLYKNGAFIPNTVSMFQARESLRRHGLLPAVNAYITTANNEKLLLAWEYATEVNRHGEFVLALAPVFNLDEITLDALFVEAASITA